MRRTSALLTALLASTLLTSCQVTPGTGRSNFNVLSAEGHLEAVRRRL
jgi:hypothetical protein